MGFQMLLGLAMNVHEALVDKSGYIIHPKTPKHIVPICGFVRDHNHRAHQNFAT